jgi:hypothetical protein
MYKKNPISSGLVTLIDPSNNNSYGTGSVIRDSSLKSNMLVEAPSAYNQLFTVDYIAAPSITDPFGGNNAYLLREFVGGGVGSVSIVLSSLGAYTPGTYTNIPTTSSTGVGCTVNFTINSSGNIVSPVTINVTGQKYSVNDTVIIPAGGSFGGTAPANNITLNVTTLVTQNKFALQSLTAEYDGNVWGRPEFSEKACITHSVYVKPVGSARRLYLVHDNVNGNGLTYDFVTNTVTNNDVSRIISTGSQVLSDGWVRVWYTYKLNTPLPASSTTVPGNTRLRMYIQNSAGAFSYIGDGTSGFYVYGHQYEYGALSNYTAKLTSTREKWFSARVTVNGNGPPGQFGELYGGAPVIKFNDPDSIGQRQGMIQYGGQNNIPATSDFSVFAWVKLDDTAAPINSFGFPSDWCNIIGRINGKQNWNDFQIKKDGRQLAFNARLTRLPGTTYVQEVIFSDILPTSIADRWVYVGITFAFENVPGGGDVFVKFYINGVQSGAAKTLSTWDYTGLDSTPTGGCYIGYNSNPTFSWGQFKGYMGMIGIYNRALTANEMLYNFNATEYRYFDDCQDITSSNLILRLDAGNTNSYPGTGITWTDISGSGNNSTLVGSPTYSTLDQGTLTFNGTSQYVNVPNSTLFQNNTNMSVSIWMNASSITSGTNYIFSLMGQGRQEERNYFWLYISGSTTPWNRINWEVGNGVSNWMQTIYNWSPTANTWYNIVATFEPGICKIYVNGVLVSTNTNPSVTFIGANNNAYPFNVGAYRNAFYFFPGKLNLPLFYDKTLSASEVLCNYNAIKHRYI